MTIYSTLPEEIPKLVKELEETGADAVLGRYDSNKSSLFRRAGSFLAKQVFFLLLGIPRALNMTPFRIIRKEIVEQMVKYGSARPRVGLILFCVTGNIVGVRPHTMRGSRADPAIRCQSWSAISWTTS